jgi:hypothetical protein
MDQFQRNLKLALAVSLVCLWAFAAVEEIEFLGDTFVLPIAAVFLQYRAQQWHQRIVWRWRQGILSFAFLGGLFGFAWLLSKFVSQETFRLVAHNPAFVLCVWAFFVFGLARQATRAA